MSEHMEADLRQGAKAAAAAAAVGAAVGMARALATRADDAARRNGRGDEPDLETEQEQEQQPEQQQQEEPEQQQEAVEAEREPQLSDDEPVQRPLRPRPPVQGASLDRISQVTATARQLLETLNGAEVESVSALQRTPDGWRVTVETVEMRRVPDSTDVLATYEVELDDDRDLVRYERTRRYSRSQSDYGSDG